MESQELKDKGRSRFNALLLLLGMLIGFLLGFLLHNFLVEHNPIPSDIKSWYPR
jgi:hypothetical protein